VGAVVVRNNQIVATGCHWQAGEPHAEVEALRRAGELAAGSTVYVTLEPCSHWGRTPPCVELLIEQKVAEVIYAFSDPNPRVAGNGERRLNEAGIRCRRVSHPDIDDFYRSYAYWCRFERPFVTAKLALSLDGKIAGPGGSRVALTGAAASEFTHTHRRRSDAILTTAETILADNPRLDARVGCDVVPKKLYVLDSGKRVHPNHEIFRWSHSVEVLPHSPYSIDWSAALDRFGSAGVHDLWIEAGGRCFSMLVRSGSLNRAFLYVAPRWLGDAAHSAFPGGEFSPTEGSREIRWRSLGDDALCEILW